MPDIEVREPDFPGHRSAWLQSDEPLVREVIVVCTCPADDCARHSLGGNR